VKVHHEKAQRKVKTLDKVALELVDMFSVCLASRTKARAGNSIAWFAVPVAKAIAPPQKTPNISVRTGRVDLSVCRRVPYVRHQNAPKELAHRFVEVTQHALAR